MKTDQQKTRNTYKNGSLSKFQPIIQSYWDEFNQVLADEKDPMCDTPRDPRTVSLIHALKSIETWKSNLFILYLHYKGVGKMAKELNVKETSLSVYISAIRKEIKKSQC